MLHLYWPRLLHDSGVNRQWLRWLLSLMIFLTFLWHRGCRCPGGQVVCPRWCIVQPSLPSGEPYGYGRTSCRTRRWYSPTGCSRMCICKSLWVFLVTSRISSASFKSHITSIATTAFCSDTTIPSGLWLVGLSFVFHQDPTHHQTVSGLFDIEGEW